jgi:hypothetical protein
MAKITTHPKALNDIMDGKDIPVYGGKVTKPYIDCAKLFVKSLGEPRSETRNTYISEFMLTALAMMNLYPGQTVTFDTLVALMQNKDIPVDEIRPIWKKYVAFMCQHNKLRRLDTVYDSEAFFVE